MPRKDYDRLVSLRDKLKDTGYELNVMGDRSIEKDVYFLALLNSVMQTQLFGSTRLYYEFSERS